MYTKQIDKFADRSHKVKQHKHKNTRQASYDISILKQTAEVATGCCASKRHILPLAGSKALSTADNISAAGFRSEQRWLPKP